MVTLLAISSDGSLTGGLEAALGGSVIGFDRAETWEEGQNDLLDEGYPGVLIDIATVEVPGHQAFVQLNDVLEKSDARAILLLRGGDGERFTAMADQFPSFVGTVDLATDRAQKLASLIQPIVDEAGGGGGDGEEQREDEVEETPVVERTLPVLESGTFDDVSLPRLVHTIEAREATGRLELSHSDLVREFPFREGQLLASGTTPVEKLQAAMAWSGGEWVFERGDVGGGEQVETLPLLLRGAYNHMEQRTAMGALTSDMSEYVAETESAASRCESLEGDGALGSFLEACDGETTLEQVLSQLGANRVDGFKAAYVACEADLAVLREESGPSPVRLEYDFDESTGSTSSDQAEAYSEPETKDREASLRKKWDEIEEASPYDVFELWEGCGEDLVKDRYYGLVKDHHPDAYGGNISEEGKELAEKIFVRIKESFSELKSREDEQVVSREEAKAQSEPEGEVPDGATTSRESAGVQAMGAGAMDDSDLADEASEPGMAAETSASDEDDRTTDSFDSTTSGPGTSQESLSDRLSTASDASETSGASSVSGGETTGEESAPDDDDEEDRTEKLKRLKQRREAATETIPPGDTGPPGDTTVPPGETSPPSDSGGGGAGLGGGDLSSGAESTGSDASSTFESSDVVEDLDPAETEDEAQEYFNKGYRAFKEENHETAFEYMAKAHEFDDSNGLYKTFYGYLLFLTKSGKQRKAHTLLKEAIDTENKQALPDAHLFLGRIYKVRDKHERAKRHFQKSLDLNPESIEAKRELRVYKIRDEDSEGGSDDDGDGTGIMDILNKDIF